MKNFKSYTQFLNEDSNFDYHINVIKKAEDYLALNGMESVGEIEKLVSNYLSDREIRPDDEKLITSLQFFKNRLGEKPNPKTSQLGKYLVKNKLAESIDESEYNVIDKATGEIVTDQPLRKDLAKKFAAKKKGWVIKSVNEAKYKVGDKIKYNIPYYDEPKDGEGVIKSVHKDGEKYSLEGGGVIYPNEIKGIAESSSEYFKLFEEFRINEQSRMKRHIAGVSKKLKDFFSAVGNESKETSEVVKLLYKANKENRDLTKAEKDQVKNQLKDVLKTIGLGSLAIMPGGFIVAVILKALKLNDKIIPSSFKKK